MTVTVTVATTTENRPCCQGGKAKRSLSPCSFPEGNLMNRCLFVLFIWASVASGHIGTRVFPFYELTDEMLETIDIHDGSVEEWYQIGEPSMTLLDFKTGRTGRSGVPDPSDLDFRIWLAWHDESNRIYTAVTTIDDVYYNEHNHNEETERYWLMLEYDSILFSLDADHSGGTGTKGVYNYVHEELLDIYGSTQWYSVIAQTQNGPTIDNRIRVSQKNHPIGNFIGEPFLDGFPSLRRCRRNGRGRAT